MNKFGAIVYILVSIAMIVGFPMVMWQEFRRTALYKKIFGKNQ